MTQRKQVNKSQLDSGINKLREFIHLQLIRKGCGEFINSHEIYGILAEEMAELLDEVRQNDKPRILEELMDIAVAALFGYISINED